ncbi:GNAT family N-acetyltransferase [Nonomuraea sp. NPDC050153]|uniref:GNAT family N-acetyltransferase n=1 Tax=Nonomuraea sp. NPDC050153 TaxID=3364359 RepID=UPI00379E4379
MTVTARPVRTRRRLRQFVELPYRLHGREAAFVPPLREDCRRLLDRRRNPFFAYGDVELFTVVVAGRVVGRIAAVHNPRHNAAHQTRDGFFGQFECVDDQAVAGALLDAAARWAGERGLTTLLGPVNFTMNDECGLLVDGFDTPPSVLMPYNPPYYRELLEGCGLIKAKDLWTWHRGSHPLDDRLRRLAEHVQRRHRLSVRPLDLGDFAAELGRIRGVYNEVWEHNWGFTPMTDAEFAALGGRLRQVIDPSLVLLAEVAGEAVGVAVVLPDVNQALPAARGRLTRCGLPIGLARLAWAARRIDRTRAVLFGVVERLRGRGVEALLYARAFEALRARGPIDCELGWTLEDNRAVNQYLMADGCVRSKTYRIYRREL